MWVKKGVEHCSLCLAFVKEAESTLRTVSMFKLSLYYCYPVLD